jgi:hypothetical protein
MDTTTRLFPNLKAKGFECQMFIINHKKKIFSATYPPYNTKSFGNPIIKETTPLPNYSQQSKRPKSPETCPICRLPYKYDHIAWARGQTDGYTCRNINHKPKTAKTPYSSKDPLSPIQTGNTRRCFICNNPSHSKINCPSYRCTYCRETNPGHSTNSCPTRKRNNTMKQHKKDDPNHYKWDYDEDGKYDDIYDGDNLNGEQ